MRKVKAGVQKKALAARFKGGDNAKAEAMEAGDGGAPFPETPARRMPFIKAKTNNAPMKGRGPFTKA